MQQTLGRRTPPSRLKENLNLYRYLTHGKDIKDGRALPYIIYPEVYIILVIVAIVILIIIQLFMVYCDLLLYFRDISMKILNLSSSHCGKDIVNICLNLYFTCCQRSPDTLLHCIIGISRIIWWYVIMFVPISTLCMNITTFDTSFLEFYVMMNMVEFKFNIHLSCFLFCRHMNDYYVAVLLPYCGMLQVQTISK